MCLNTQNTEQRVNVFTVKLVGKCIRLKRVPLGRQSHMHQTVLITLYKPFEITNQTSIRKITFGLEREEC